MFVIDFSTMMVWPSDDLDADSCKKVQDTIDRLKLNDEGTCLKSRTNYVDLYCNRDINFAHLEREAPFIAYELRRQRIKTKIRDMWLTPG